jgi:putative hydrolase of the HAD superfamily
MAEHDPPRPIRAVLFDVYGTLLDSAAGDRPPDDVSLASLLQEPRPGLLKDLRRTIEETHATSPHPHPEIDIREMWSRVLPSLSAEEIERFALKAEDLLSPATAMPGAVETLRGLASAGIPLGIVSNAQFYTPSVMERCLGGTLEQLGFDPLLCLFSWQHGRAKPDPWLFQTVLSRLLERGISADEILYVGNDVMRDIIPARDCGFRTALLVGSPALRLHGYLAENSGATFLMERLNETLKLPGITLKH